MSINFSEVLKEQFSLFYGEDDISKNLMYLNSLPEESVRCVLKIKDDMVLAGLPFFFEAFNYLSCTKINYSKFLIHEGKRFSQVDKQTIEFELPFNLALSGERIALNLLQRASSIATHTAKFVDKLPSEIKILDTRKTTPGLRFLEKYAVNLGGGYNHRFGQMDAWMIKDNHKTVFGGLKNAVDFFKNLKAYYAPLIVEIHDLAELEEAMNCGVSHFLLDNFTPDELKKAITMKRTGMNYEVSGGITLENISAYMVNGVDAFSSGSLTYNAPQVDISLKFKRASHG